MATRVAREARAEKTTPREHTSVSSSSTPEAIATSTHDPGGFHGKMLTCEVSSANEFETVVAKPVT